MLMRKLGHDWTELLLGASRDKGGLLERFSLGRNLPCRAFHGSSQWFLSGDSSPMDGALGQRDTHCRRCSCPGLVEYASEDDFLGDSGVLSRQLM